MSPPTAVPAEGRNYFFLFFTLASENLVLIAEHLATKDDFAALRSEMHVEFSRVRSEVAIEFTKARGETSTEFANLRGEMAKLENRLLLKMTAIIAGLLTLFRLLD